MRLPGIMHRVVILGGGFGGLYAAKALRHAPVDVTLIDRRNFHLFQPLLYQVATGSLSPGEIAAPLRSVLSRHSSVRVLLDEADSIARWLASRAAVVSRGLVGRGRTLAYSLGSKIADQCAGHGDRCRKRDSSNASWRGAAGNTHRAVGRGRGAVGVWRRTGTVRGRPARPARTRAGRSGPHDRGTSGDF